MHQIGIETIEPMQSVPRILDQVRRFGVDLHHMTVTRASRELFNISVILCGPTAVLHKLIEKIAAFPCVCGVSLKPTNFRADPAFHIKHTAPRRWQ